MTHATDGRHGSTTAQKVKGAAALLLTGGGEMVLLNAVGLGLILLQRFMPRRRVGKLRR